MTLRVPTLCAVGCNDHGTIASRVDGVADVVDGLLVARVDVLLVCGTTMEGWLDQALALRSRHPDARVVVLAADIAEAVRMVNTLGVDALIDDLAALPETIARLVSAPPSHQIELERLVQKRTAILQQVKRQWEQSFDALADPMALMDASYRIVRVNRAYAASLEHTIVDVPGHTCYALRAASPRAFATDATGRCACCPLRATLDSGEPSLVFAADASGARWAVSSHVVTDEVDGDDGAAGPRYLVHYRDVTREARRLSQIAQADKLSAVGKLAGELAHQLNNPMTNIMVFSELLAERTDAGSALRAHAEEVHESARRCRRLIQGLLRFARRQRPAQLERVVLGHVLDDVLPLVQHRVAKHDVTLEIDLPTSIKPVLAHVADVEHVMVNLISNALDACGRGDIIRVSAKSVPSDQLVELRISDSGRGMSQDQLAQAFDAFYSSAAADGAAGLGLTTCEAIIAELGGTIDLESELGVGTTARVLLPMAVD